MAEMRKGDIVVRKSYGYDVPFKVEDIYKDEKGDTHVILRGIIVRLLADAPYHDLVKIPEEKAALFKKKISEHLGLGEYGKRIVEGALKSENSPPTGRLASFPGVVLHLDGDEQYMQKCLELYKHMKVPAIAKNIPENQLPQVVKSLLAQYSPDILVLTGHDGLIKGNNPRSIESYRTSKFYIQAVQEARRYEASKDDLVIFAGACQSYYEGIIKAGANFASSPERVLISWDDPVLVAEKISSASVREIANVDKIIASTVTGIKGIGGIETRGKFRSGMPAIN